VPRRLARWCFLCFSVASLVLCLAAITVWIRSAVVPDGVAWEDSSGVTAVAAADGRGLVVFEPGATLDDMFGPVDRRAGTAAGRHGYARTPRREFGPPLTLAAVGCDEVKVDVLSVGWGSKPSDPEPRRTTYLALPLWFVSVAFAVAPAVWLTDVVRRRRRRRRQQSGRVRL